MTTFGIDFAWHPPYSATALKKHGVSFVARYLSNDPGKDLSPSEAQALRNAGIEIVVVWETTANRALASYTAGRTDATAAKNKAAACGLTKSPIYFAVDFESSGKDVQHYFEGVKSILGSRTGVYGSYACVHYLLNHGLAAYAWQTYAWSKGLFDSRSNIYQYSNDHIVLGIECDYDHKYDKTTVIAKVKSIPKKVKLIKKNTAKPKPGKPPKLVPKAPVVPATTWEQFIKELNVWLSSFLKFLKLSGR